MSSNIRSASVRGSGRQRLKNRRQGSALVLTLLLVGVLAISIAAMLSSVRYLSHTASDKIAMEECYQTALSGINLARAWIMTPDLASRQARNAGVGAAFDAIQQGAMACSQAVINNRTNANFIRMSAANVRGYYTGTSLNRFGDPHNGREIIHEWSNAGGMLLSFPSGDANGGSPTGEIVNTNRTDTRSWIERLTITTPYPGQDDMRFVSFIIEAEAVTRSAGNTKRRILTSKVLAIPKVDGVNETRPLAQSNAAVVSGGGVDTSNNNNSSMNIHWGPVWSKGNITVLGLSLDGKTLSVAANKYTGIGTQGEKWVKWQAGSQGSILGKNGASIFPANGINSLTVRDFFGQIKTGQFGQEWLQNIRLGGDFSPSSLDSTDPTTGKPLYYGLNKDGAPETDDGAFVQKTAAVDSKVNQLYASLDYSTWKNYAIQMKGYIRPTSSAGNSFVNETGQPLYVTPQKSLTTISTGNTLLTDISQISMKDLVPPNGLTSGIEDRILFIDSVEGTEQGTTRLNLQVNSSLAFFWKGMFWHHGSMDVAGGGAFPDVWGQNPDQYGRKTPNPSDSTSGQTISKCFIDGILRLTGNLNRTGNSAVYGSLVVGTGNNGVFTGAGTFDVYYNPRVGDGLFQPTRPQAGQEPRIRGLVGGPITELPRG